MKIGFIGLGKMGYNMVLNLLDNNHKVVAFNRSPAPVKKVARRGAIPAQSIEKLISKLPKPRVLWIMITAGNPVDAVIGAALPHLQRGDIIIDGGNSYFKDSQGRYAKLSKKGIHFLDCGVSGGVEGARNGACMMVGGDLKAFKRVERLFRDQCVKGGYGYMGRAGAGHYVKMVHNAIEYGMIGAIAEGMGALRNRQRSFGFDFSDVLRVYANGSIIEGRLVHWLARAWQKDRGLSKIKGTVPVGGTESEMRKLESFEKMTILHEARLMRARTRKTPSFVGKVISAIRHEFGGHPVKKK